MKTVQGTLGLFVLTLAMTASADEPGYLANEKIILPSNVNASTGSTFFDSQKGLVRLSPNGKQVLYWQQVEADSDGKPLLKPVLRDLTDGSEQILPVPAFSERFMRGALMMSFSANVFNKSGDKLVLGVGVDANNDGVFDQQNEKMRAVVFNATNSTTSDLSVTADLVVAGYDKSGEHLVALTADRGDENQQIASMTLRVSPVNHIDWQEHTLTATPKAISPSADRLLLIKMSDVPLRTGRRSRQVPNALVLYDTNESKETATLPTFDAIGALSLFVYVTTPQWTSSGDYLYYIDLLADSENPNAERPRPRHGTKVWSHDANRVTREMPNVLPLAPGPTETSAVLLQVDEVKENGTKVLGIVVHDAPSNQVWHIPLPNARVIGTNGSSLIYAKPEADGKESVYMADIVLPK